VVSGTTHRFKLVVITFSGSFLIIATFGFLLLDHLDHGFPVLCIVDIIFLDAKTCGALCQSSGSSLIASVSSLCSLVQVIVLRWCCFGTFMPIVTVTTFGVCLRLIRSRDPFIIFVRVVLDKP